MKHLILALLFLLPGCTLISDLKETAAVLKEVAVETRQFIATSAAAADTDKSGDTSGSEWAAWLAAGGGSAILAWITVMLRKLRGETDELWDKTHKPVVPQ